MSGFHGVIQLRPYQQAAIDAVYASLASRADHPCVVIPTGGGKGVVVGRICADVVERWNGRILVVTHVKELWIKMLSRPAAF